MDPPSIERRNVESGLRRKDKVSRAEKSGGVPSRRCLNFLFAGLIVDGIMGLNMLLNPAGSW